MSLSILLSFVSAMREVGAMRDRLSNDPATDDVPWDKAAQCFDDWAADHLAQVIAKYDDMRLDEVGGLTIADLTWLYEGWQERLAANALPDDHEDHDRDDGYEDVMTSLGYVALHMDGRVSVFNGPERTLVHLSEVF